VGKTTLSAFDHAWVVKQPFTTQESFLREEASSSQKHKAFEGL
jgi:hypothetical protein